MKKDLINEKLTAYALGELSENDRLEVETLLRENPDLQKELEAIRIMANMLSQEFQSEAKTSMNAGDKQVFFDKVDETKVRSPFFTIPRHWFLPVTGLATACLAIIVTVGIRKGPNNIDSRVAQQVVEVKKDVPLDKEIGLGAMAEEEVTPAARSFQPVKPQALANKKSKGRRIKRGEPAPVISAKVVHQNYKTDTDEVALDGRVGTKLQVALELGGAGESYSARINVAKVKDAFATNKVSVQACYERERIKNPKLQGSLTFVFDVNKQGRLAGTPNVRWPASTMKNRVVAGCILALMPHWQFPEPQKSQIVTIVFPVRFKLIDPEKYYHIHQ